ncbi:MAG: hypothetical protein JNL21_04745 [Myxococcales bacterium]|nr:hypothetical protein [Myxococcales bacterium]
MSEPLVVLEDVVARDRAGARDNPRGRLAGLGLRLERGVVAVLGTPEDGAIALFEVLTGARRPDRGKVLVRGADPARSAAVRASIGAVGLVAALPPAPTVEGALAIALGARGGGDGRALLAEAGLAALAGRAPSDVPVSSQRALELCLALAIDAPALVVVHEPFSDMAGDHDHIVRSIRAAGDRAPVVVITSSPADAERFDRVLVLVRGAIVRESTSPHAELGAPLAASLVAWVGEGARDLARVLSLRPEVASLILSADAPGGLSVVRVAGTDLDALALAFAEASAEVGAAVEVLREIPPVLGEVTALSEWELRARQLTAMHLAAADARLRAELAAREAHERGAALAARRPAWGPAAPAETSPGVLAPAAAAPPQGGPPADGGGGAR